MKFASRQHRALVFQENVAKPPTGKGSASRAHPAWEGGAASRFLAFFAFFLNFNFISIFMGLRPHFGRFLVSKPRFWLAKTLPKSTQNAFKIEVPKNMQFFSAFLFIFSLNLCCNLLKTCIFPRENRFF